MKAYQTKRIRHIGIMYLWFALHSLRLTYKYMVDFVSSIMGYLITQNQIKYQIERFNLTLKQARKNLSQLKSQVLFLLWST
jgi:hypothetical protein